MGSVMFTMTLFSSTVLMVNFTALMLPVETRGCFDTHIVLVLTAHEVDQRISL